MVRKRARRQAGEIFTRGGEISWARLPMSAGHEITTPARKSLLEDTTAAAGAAGGGDPDNATVCPFLLVIFGCTLAF